MVETAAGSMQPEPLRAAATLLRGELLEGLAVGEPGFERWLAAERERFRLMAFGHPCRTSCTRRKRGDASPRRSTTASGCSCSILCRKTCTASLMRLHAAQGRHDAALAVFERCRHTLADELGVAPDAETEALARGDQGAAGPREDARDAAASDRGACAAPRSLSCPSPRRVGRPGSVSRRRNGRGHHHRAVALPVPSGSLPAAPASRFRGQDSAAVGEGLGVRYLVEGSVRRSGPRIRVSAQLVDTSTGTQVWAERYERRNEDIFEVQDAVAGAVVATVEGRIAARGAEHARRKPTEDWAAYDFLLRGRECNHHYRVAEGERFFARAVEIDPGYVQAHAWRAVMLGVMYLHDEQEETLAAAFRSAREALSA